MRYRRFLLVLLLAAPASAAPRSYRVDAAASRVEVQVGKTGAFSFAGHTHLVRAPEVAGTVVADPDDLAGSSVELSFAAGSLVVEPAGADRTDAPKVQEVMRGPQVLDVGRFASISLRSRAVAGQKAADGSWSLRVTGELALHGMSREVTLPVQVRLAGDRLTATAHVALRQSDYGIEPVTAGGGTVKVKDEVTVDVEIVATAVP